MEVPVSMSHARMDTIGAIELSLMWKKRLRKSTSPKMTLNIITLCRSCYIQPALISVIHSFKRNSLHLFTAFHLPDPVTSFKLSDRSRVFLVD